ncbi:DUF4179 domain-containing protein [Paenibacillus oleatilyticus]|uniref:DUF4179 domain-containing protein n=1 Tax=Paenibacillus oleatilyticus TaxID=2594886 RepID=UPI001C1F2279|nr:DUF4179 domain-containing protein [Paenibacillus oleatilyticus]MBU7315501.1 DUF4179 domain-containing protein [Paenibacillus oleatilyticus]
MTLHLDQKGREKDGSMESSEAVQSRLKRLSPSFTFEELWELHQQSARGGMTLRKKRMILGYAVILCAILLTGIGLYSPSVGAALQKVFFIDLFYKNVRGGMNSGLYQIERQNLGTATDVSVTDQNIQLTVAEVFYDGIQFVVNYQVDYLKKKKITEEDAAVYYNYKFKDAHPTMIGTHAFTITSDHAFIGTTVFNTEPLPENARLQIEIRRIGTTDGNWDVTVPVSLNKAKPLTKIVRPQIAGDYEGKKFMVDQITFTPVGTQVVIKTDHSGSLSYFLEDDLETHFDGGGGMGGNGEDRNNFSPLSEINPKPAYVTLLVKDLTSEQSNTLQQREEYADYTGPGSLPVTLKGARGGKVTITDVQFLEDSAVVYYEASDAVNQRPFLILEDSSGERFTSQKKEVRTSRDSFAYKLQYPKLPSDRFTFKLIVNEYSQEPKEPVKIKIPIDWE